MDSDDDCFLDIIDNDQDREITPAKARQATCQNCGSMDLAEPDEQGMVVCNTCNKGYFNRANVADRD